ncbi:MAG: DUF2442 domain-containing protein [Candidatus Brocadia sp.]|nr:DUF2442 domain-containing protein [Candidatus Brocadia sp.]UJS17509.1 MAG: DUF2442 domain-containing protein [Candidatus Jettenia sp.]
MNPRVKAVKARDNYKLEITFSNGEFGVYDCSPLFHFGVFPELKDKIYSQQVRAVHGTVVWPHGQDICPDTLYLDSIKIKKTPNKSLHRTGTKSRAIR